MSRAQAEIIGITLLIGFVLVSAGAVFVVGSSVLSPLEAQSEHEQNIDEAQQLGHEIETLMRSSNGDADVALRDGYEVSEDGANVTITVDGDEQDPIQTGQLERDSVVYEGGLIVDDETGQVISSPPFELRDGSSHMQFPALESESGQFGGALEQSNVSSIDSPAEERLEIEIESEYYEQWADLFTNAETVSKDHDENKVYIVYDMLDGLSETESAISMGSSTFNLNENPNTTVYSYDESNLPPEDTNANAQVTANISETGNQGGDVHVNGKFIYDESGENPNRGEGNDKVSDTEGGPHAGTVEELYPTDKLLINSTGTGYDGSHNLSEGGYFNDDDELVLDTDVTVTGDSILVVENDLKISDGTTITVLENLDIHVHGNVTIEEGAEIKSQEEYDATSTSLFVGGDSIHINGPNDGAAFTGLIHATDASIEITDKFYLFGAAILDEVQISDKADQENPQHTDFKVYQDERLGDRSTPFAVSGEITKDFESYLGNSHEFDIRITEIEAE